MYISISIYIHMYMHTYIYTYILLIHTYIKYIHKYIHIRTRAHTYIHICKYACIYVLVFFFFLFFFFISPFLSLPFLVSSDADFWCCHILTSVLFSQLFTHMWHYLVLSFCLRRYTVKTTSPRHPDPPIRWERDRHIYVVIYM